MSAVDINSAFWYYRLFKTSLMFTCAIIGTISNILIIGAVLVERRLKYIGSALIVNLAIADMLVTSITIPVLSMNIWYEGMATDPRFCVFFGTVTVWSCSASLQNLTAIGFDRYVLICHDKIHRRFFGPKLIAGLVIYTWVSTAILQSVLIYYDDLGYYAPSEMCSVRYINLPLWFNQFVVIFYCILPMALCFYFYFKIFMTIKKSKNRIASIAKNTSENKSKKHEATLFRTLIVVFVTFFLCWTPYNLVAMLVDYKFQVPNEVYAWSSNVALINSILNGFIYGLSNKLFRSGYLKIVKILFCYHKWRPVKKQKICSQTEYTNDDCVNEIVTVSRN